MDFFNSVIAFFQTGGAFMYPILVVFALGAAVAVERYIRLVYERHTNRAMWDKLQPVLTSGDFDRARNLVKQDNSGVSKLLSMGLARQGAVRRREDIEIAMEESMMEIIPQLEKRTPYVALFSNIATLLGLLGTIMGLIEAFTAVANANPAEKADLLSASISVAMNTTAFGLMVGITLLIVHALLNSLTGEIVDSLEMVSVKALNIISISTRRRGEVKPDEQQADSQEKAVTADAGTEAAAESEAAAETDTPEQEEEVAEVEKA
ncbi:MULTISPECIES: MotA/TolQ/ExbB proton channel family protein [Microbulbifer]|uniref:MotA/TolQ/ExbB proton channel family protein n=1 Tax=Microbulbifer TaxID=48073 RepID=UPI001E64E6C8|nr:MULTISPECIES: MotA/TolQ/ExbB proton channel family protein [Microbulbifer]UHQ56571.1 MotA/TolQ/ExbB proton channel family protein [Microbulbifer sp. YPW16]